jgi:cytochrome P450
LLIVVSPDAQVELLTVQFPGPTEEGLKYIRDMMDKYNTAIRGWFGPYIATVITFHPTTTREILQTAEPKSTRVGAYRFGRSWIGDGLLFSGGKKWARNRRLLTPAFHFDILKPYIKIKNDAMAPLLVGDAKFFFNHTQN